MGTEEIILDDMPEKAHKKIHNVSFVFAALIVGVVLFFISQMAFAFFVVDEDERAEMFGENSSSAEVTEEKFLGHDYCGTFYIWLSVENSYGTAENCKAADNAADPAILTPLSIGDIIANVLMFVCVFLAFRKADKKRFFCQNGWKFLMTAGVAMLIKGIWTVPAQIYMKNAEQPYVTGIFADRSYYCQIYQLFGIPALIIMTALITRQHSLNVQQKETAGNSNALKAFSVLMGAVTSAFMLIRFVTRIYEIASYKTHDSMLPFYSDLLTFPRELADSPETYRDLLIFRLIKDLPVFIASGLTVYLLIRIMISSARGEINTQKNMKRYNICMLALLTSSVLFNVLGLHEVDVLNGHFSGIYGNVVYTIGIRALTDPALYAVILWFCKTFVSIAGNRDTEAE